MIGNKPSIYNAQSVYNQGGGSGTFKVDIGGGVYQTLVFPPYLIPVEYIDNSNNSDNNFCLMASEQMPIASQANNLFIKFVIKANKNYLGDSGNRNVVYKYIPQWMFSNNNDIRASVSKNNNNNPLVTLYFGNKTHTFSINNIDSKLTLIMNASVNKFIVFDDEGFYQEYTDSRVPPAYNFGHVSVFNSMYETKIYKGSFYYGYVANNSTKEILSLLVPARAKNLNDKKPYIVECVGGSVLINCSENLNTTGFEFGQDINLDEIQQYIE